MNERIKYSIKLALLMWSANFLSSCNDGLNASIEIDDFSKIPTLTSDSLTVISSKNGNIEYRFKTPLLERFGKATEPYMLYSKGIEIETFDDSTRLRDAYLRADYAIFNETAQLWEAKGNVIGVNTGGDTLYTQQIFWDQKGKKIYSNVDTKIKTGNETVLGAGFESSDRLDNIILGNNRGRFAVDVAATDSTAVDTK